MTVLNIVTVRQGLSGPQTDMAALAQVMLDPSPDLTIYFPEGGGTGPGGTYLISTDPWQPFPTPSRGNITRSHVTLEGDGTFRTIIQQPYDSNLMFMAHVDPAAPTNVLSDITFSKMSLVGNLAARMANDPASYNEHNNLVQIAGVTNIRAEDVEFRDFMGDGLYLGSPKADLVTHNTNLVVLRCRFDGVSKRNRNGISITDCNGWTVSGCAFLNISDSARNAPGAIDVEPEASGSIVLNGTVFNSSFDNIGGDAVALLNGAGATASGLQFTYCSVRNMYHGILSVQNFSDVTAANLYAETMGRVALIRRTTNTTIRDSTLRDGDLIRLGGLSPDFATNVVIQNNGIVNCGKVNGPVIAQDGNINGVHVLGNNVIDSGRAGFVSPLYFLQGADAALAQVTLLRVQNNIVQGSSSHVTDIGRVDGSRPPNTYYSNVNRDPNTPSRIPGGAENLNNVP